MTKMFKQLIQLTLFVAILLLPTQTHAARMYFVAESAQLHSDGFFQMDIFVDTQDEVVNAFEGSVVLPIDLVNVVDIRDGASFVSLWIERPQNLGNGEVHYSGIIPGGISGSDIFLFSIVGQVKDLSTRSLSITPNYGQVRYKDVQVLLHDGLGSPASTLEEVFPFTITSVAAVPEEKKAILTIEDQEPPEQFAPIITKDENLFEGNYSLIFSTQDKGTGVSHYELLTTPKPLKDNDADFIEEGWEQIESPLLLVDQTLSENLYVKAVDKVGNERIVLVPAKNPMITYQKPLFWVIISVGIILLALMIILLRRARRDMKQIEK